MIKELFQTIGEDFFYLLLIKYLWDEHEDFLLVRGLLDFRLDREQMHISAEATNISKPSYFQI